MIHSGDVFHRMTAVKEQGFYVDKKYGKRKQKWLFVCECGTKK